MNHPGPAFTGDPSTPEAVMSRRPSWISRKPLGLRPPTPVPPAPAEPTVELDTSPAVGVPVESPPPETTVDPALTLELERLREENVALQGRIAEMAVTMARLRRDVLEASEPELVQLSLSIAERVVGRELALDPGLVVAWAREAVQALASKNEVVIALAKDLASEVPAGGWGELQPRVEIDPDVPPGTVEVRAPEAVVAAGASARLSSVAQALGVSES